MIPADVTAQVAKLFFEKRSPGNVSWDELDSDVRSGWVAYAERQLTVMAPALERWVDQVAENVRRYYTE